MSFNDHKPATRRGKIIYAWNYVRWGGAQIYLLSLIKGVLEEFDVVVILPLGSDPQLLSFLDNLGVEYDFFSPAADQRRPKTIKQRVARRWLKIRSEGALRVAIEKHRTFDSIVHVDLAPQQSVRTLILLCRSGIVFISSHNSNERHSLLREMLWTIGLRAVSRCPNFNIFCANRDAQRYLCSYLPEDLCERIIITRAAVDRKLIESVYLERDSKDKIREEFGIPKDKIVVLTVGQFIDRKGRWELMEAASDVLKHSAQVKFVWLTAELPNEIDAERVRSYNLGESFRLIKSSTVGNDRNSILRFFLTADIFVLPSLKEGLPIAILEAMALGLPTISTRINAIPEVLIDNKTGLSVLPGDAGELSRAIEKLLRDGELRSELAEEGRRFVLENFDDRKTVNIAMSAYRKALDRTINAG